MKAVVSEDAGRTAALDDVLPMLGLAADIPVRDVMDARSGVLCYMH